ncbi:MAG: acetate/propionate family kinase [Spirulinaceae cyanobacterium]
MKILVLNAGSSSQKSCLYDLDPSSPLPDTPPEPLWEGMIDWSNAAGPELTVEIGGRKQTCPLKTSDRAQALGDLLSTLVTGDAPVLNTLDEIDIVGHRVVHGGTAYSQATRITREVRAEIERLIPLAPSHNPAHLEGIAAIETLLGNIPQVAVFDTAFHSQMPDAIAAYPLPYEWFEQGIRRYGFHGTSHAYCSQRAAQLLGRPLADLRLVTCHLGNGASLAAVQNGRSIDTTMGFTPLEGLMMGTRSGSTDPAIALYLMREEGFTPDRLDRMLNRESGLKGIFGESGDLRAILAARAAGDERATLAFGMYIHRLKSAIAAMTASLGGLDALVFTAGVGEHSPQVRAAACAGLGFLGVHLDGAKNQANPRDIDIAAVDSPVRILVIHTQEDWAIARECWHYVQDHFK